MEYRGSEVQKKVLAHSRGDDLEAGKRVFGKEGRFKCFIILSMEYLDHGARLFLRKFVDFTEGEVEHQLKDVKAKRKKVN